MTKEEINRKAEKERRKRTQKVEKRMARTGAESNR